MVLFSASLPVEVKFQNSVVKLLESGGGKNKGVVSSGGVVYIRIMVARVSCGQRKMCFVRRHHQSSECKQRHNEEMRV